MGTHKHHSHKHHSTSSRHSSTRHKSKSKHKHHSHKKRHHHHRHHHHKKKSHHSKHEPIELHLEDKVLQNALDCLEAGALSVMKDGTELTPDALDALVSNTITKAKRHSTDKGDSEESDSDSSSGDSLSEEDTEVKKETKNGIVRGIKSPKCEVKLSPTEAKKPSAGSNSGSSFESVESAKPIVKSVEKTTISDDSRTVSSDGATPSMGERRGSNPRSLKTEGDLKTPVPVVTHVPDTKQAVPTKSPELKTGTGVVKTPSKEPVGKASDVEEKSSSGVILKSSNTTNAATTIKIVDFSSSEGSDSDEEQDEDLPIMTKKMRQKSTIQIKIKKSLDDGKQDEVPPMSSQTEKNVSKVKYVNLKPVTTGGVAVTKGKSASKRRSRTRSVSDERSSPKKKKKKHSRSRSRHRSHSRSKHRSHSRSRHRSHSKSRRRSRDSHRRKRSSSPYSRNKHRKRRRRPHSRSRSRSHRSYSRSHSRSSSRSISPTSKKIKMSFKQSQVARSIPVIAKDLSKNMEKKTKQKTISTLTDFCKDLQKKQEIENEMSPEALQNQYQVAPVEYRAPYMVNDSSYQPGLVYHNSAWKTANQIVAESNAVAGVKPLTDQFPVSTGMEHKATDLQHEATGNVFGCQQSVDISDLAVKRVLATERLKLNPADMEAMNILIEVEHKTQVWANSKVTPGQFTGQKKLSGLTKDDHKAGLQAWAKKNMFRDLAPVMSGFGMKMMKKMGWSEGKPLGKTGEGHTEPIPMDVKLDRSGLSTEMDKLMAIVNPGPTVMVAPTLKAADQRSAHLVQGKHPVSALQEICSKKRWPNPDYKLVDVAGPPHLTTFLYEVTVPLGTFRSANGSKSKKQAKMEAATAVLQGLGLVKKT